MTSNTQGDTPPIQPDAGKLKEIADLLRHNTEAGKREAVLAWHQQALERERLKAQTAAAVTIREKLANATTNTPAWAGGVEIVNDYIEENEARLSTLTNKDKDNKAQLAQPSKGDK